MAQPQIYPIAFPMKHLIRLKLETNGQWLLKIVNNMFQDRNMGNSRNIEGHEEKPRQSLGPQFQPCVDYLSLARKMCRRRVYRPTNE